MFKSYKKALNKSVRYSKLATDKEHLEFIRERDYRNYGVALENKAKLLGMKDETKVYTIRDKHIEAHEYYKLAFEKDSNIYNGYYALLSSCNTLIQDILSIKNRTPECNETRNFKALLASIKNENTSEANKYINEALVYSGLAKRTFPTKPEFYAFHIYANLYAACTGMKSINEELKETIDLDVEYILFLNGNSPLCKAIKLEVDDFNNDFFSE